jgi:hypothetical protein
VSWDQLRWCRGVQQKQRIQYGLPLILFLLQRHHQIMRLACKHPLDDRELWEAECSVNILADAVGLRISTLESIS